MKKNIGECYIKITKNNMFVTVIEEKDKKIIAQGSAGYVQMQGPRKKMPYAGELLGRKIGENCLLLNCKVIDIHLHSYVCKKVRSIIRGIIIKGVKIREIILDARIAHNGVRLRKSKRR